MKNQPADIIEAFEPELLEKLTLFCDRLIVWNKKFSLTSVPDDQIFKRLIAPSAWLGLQYGKEEIGTVVDFGSGPGIPGLAMALADSTNRYLLIDSNQKKIGFIKHCLTYKGLFENSIVESQLLRVEEGISTEKFDRVVTRAAGSVTSTIRLLKGKIKEDAILDFFKGSEIKEEVAELNRTNPEARVEVMETPGWFNHLQVLRVYRA